MWLQKAFPGFELIMQVRQRALIEVWWLIPSFDWASVFQRTCEFGGLGKGLAARTNQALNDISKGREDARRP